MRIIACHYIAKGPERVEVMWHQFNLEGEFHRRDAPSLNQSNSLIYGWSQVEKPEGGSHDADLARVQEGDKTGDDSSVHDALDLLVWPISQV